MTVKPTFRIIYRVLRAPVLLAEYIDNLRKRRRCIVFEGAVLHPSSRVLNNRQVDNIVVGAKSQVLAILETLGHGGRIEIGNNCYIGEYTRISSAISVKVGNRVLISHNVNIFDWNSHSTSAAKRAKHFEHIFQYGHPLHLEDVPDAPVLIEDDAWVGFGATILKGVTVGKGSIVGAGSMVTKNVAPYTIVAGNPARVLRKVAYE